MGGGRARQREYGRGEHARGAIVHSRCAISASGERPCVQGATRRYDVNADVSAMLARLRAPDHDVKP